LGKRYEQKGIQSYDFMYEDDKMEYINKVYDRTAYDKARDARWAELDAIYGKNTEVGTPEYKAKAKAKKDWITENNKYVEGIDKAVPDPEKYPSKYDTWTSTQQEFYDEWMEIKEELDNILGSNKTYLYNSIKIRKSNIERLHATLTGDGLAAFADGVSSKLKSSFDDDYAKKDKKSIKNFNGTEFMKLPLYYLYADKKDARDISTDAIGTLIAYTDMVYNYEAMNEIVSPLEVGRELVSHRQIRDTRNGRNLSETFLVKNAEHEEPIYVNTNQSNFMKALNDFFESKIYERYLKTYDDLPGGIDKNKATSALLKLGSTV